MAVPSAAPRSTAPVAERAERGSRPARRQLDRRTARGHRRKTSPATCVRCSARNSAICVALFEVVVDRLGDDFGLLARDAPGGELLGDAPPRADVVAANEEGFRTWLDWTGRIAVSPADRPAAGTRCAVNRSAVIGLPAPVGSTSRSAASSRPAPAAWPRSSPVPFSSRRLCRTPEQMRPANPFCRFLELATPQTAAPARNGSDTRRQSSAAATSSPISRISSSVPLLNKV